MWQLYLPWVQRHAKMGLSCLAAELLPTGNHARSKDSSEQTATWDAWHGFLWLNTQIGWLAVFQKSNVPQNPDFKRKVAIWWVVHVHFEDVNLVCSFTSLQAGKCLRLIPWEKLNINCKRQLENFWSQLNLNWRHLINIYFLQVPTAPVHSCDIIKSHSPPTPSLCCSNIEYLNECLFVHSLSWLLGPLVHRLEWSWNDYLLIHVETIYVTAKM